MNVHGDCTTDAMVVILHCLRQGALTHTERLGAALPCTCAVLRRRLQRWLPANGAAQAQQRKRGDGTACGAAAARRSVAAGCICMLRFE